MDCEARIHPVKGFSVYNIQILSKRDKSSTGEIFFCQNSKIRNQKHNQKNTREESNMKISRKHPLTNESHPN